MTMPAFPTSPVPSTSSTLQENPRALFAQFGGNYAQQAPDGINNIVATWTLSFENLSAADSNTMSSFIRSNYFNFFTWTPPEGLGTVWRIDPAVNSYGQQKSFNGLVSTIQVSLKMVY